jgi:hypothetical protein
LFIEEVLVIGLCSGFIKATLAQVPNPFDYVMIAVVQFRLKNLQIANLEPRARKRYLKVH